MHYLHEFILQASVSSSLMEVNETSNLNEVPILQETPILPTDNDAPSRPTHVKAPSSFGSPLCRICYGGADDEKLIRPCLCAGSMENIHQSCLLTWLRSGATHCEICQAAYQFRRRVKEKVCLLYILMFFYFSFN